MTWLRLTGPFLQKVTVVQLPVIIDLVQDVPPHMKEPVSRGLSDAAS